MLKFLGGHKLLQVTRWFWLLGYAFKQNKYGTYKLFGKQNKIKYSQIFLGFGILRYYIVKHYDRMHTLICLKCLTNYDMVTIYMNY